MTMTRVYIGLGSNLGEKSANIKEALTRLEAGGVARVIACSAEFVTQPVGVDGKIDASQPDFINAAIEAETALSPEELLVALKEIETAMGREAVRQCGPRLIDMDILLYGNEIVEHDGLTIPHARMHERDFVLRPLAEIAPDAMHPKLKLTAAEMLAKLSKNADS